MDRCLEEEETPRGDFRSARGADEVYLVPAGAESTAGSVAGGQRVRHMRHTKARKGGGQVFPQNHDLVRKNQAADWIQREVSRSKNQKSLKSLGGSRNENGFNNSVFLSELC